MFFADALFIPNEKGELISVSSTIPEAVAQLPPTDMGATLIKMLLTLAGLIALLFATYWFLRRIIQHRLQKGAGQPAIQIIEKRMLSPKTMLYVVQIEQKKILFAESHLEIKVLDTLTEIPLEEEPPTTESP